MAMTPIIGLVIVAIIRPIVIIAIAIEPAIPIAPVAAPVIGIAAITRPPFPVFPMVDGDDIIVLNALDLHGRRRGHGLAYRRHG